MKTQEMDKFMVQTFVSINFFSKLIYAFVVSLNEILRQMKRVVLEESKVT